MSLMLLSFSANVFSQIATTVNLTGNASTLTITNNVATVVLTTGESNVSPIANFVRGIINVSKLA